MLSSIVLEREGHSHNPLYQQVVDAIVGLIERGHLPNGSKLPTIRSLSQQLEVTRVTIHKAYQELQDQGWVEATVGRGTFVSHLPASRLEPVASTVHGLTADKAMADISAVRQRPGTISLAMAEPDPRLYPGTSFVRLFRSLEDRAEDLLRYGSYQGDPHLRQMIAGLLAARGIKAHFEDIIVTTGVTQGLSMCMASLCEPGDKVLVEEPTYLGFLSLLKSYDLVPIGVAMDEEGMVLERVEALIQQHQPKVLYTIPSFQNPSGVQMSASRRTELLALARKHHIAVLEDDVYGDIRFDGPRIAPLRSQDEDVIYVNSFSKNLFPGLRVGYILPPAGLKHSLMTLLRCRSLCGPSLLQEALKEFLRRGSLGEHLARVLPIYQERRDALMEALDAHMPEEVSWSEPKGGFCTWLTMPSEGVYDDLYREALLQGVAFTPGGVFFSRSSDASHLRLCYSVPDAHLIDKAVAVLGGLIRACIHTPIFHLGATPIV